MGLPAVVEFKGQELEVEDINGKPWLRGAQIGCALGYKNGSDAISDIYNRNKDEFTEQETSLLNLRPQFAGAGQTRKTRIFSPRGCHLIGMFARTERAKAFRKWVLDVLEKLGEGASAAGREQMRETLSSVPLVKYAALLEEQVSTLKQLIALKGQPKPKRQAAKPLTESEIARIRELRKKGMSLSQIAKVTGRCGGSISWVVRGAGRGHLTVVS